jgi:anaerobic C4-dicarboxylate transporter DcuA
LELLTILLQGAVVLGAIYMGVRTGGMGLGMWGVVGVTVLVLIFHVPPGAPPIDAMLIILSVVVAAATMQAAGGIDYLVGTAARIIRRNPGQITYIAPQVAFLFTMAAGTGNIFFALIPVIYQVAYDNGVRPERPLAVASVASQMGIVASPVSAAMAAMLTLVEPKGFSLIQILAIVFPAGVVAVLVASVVQARVGKPLEQDPDYLRRLAAGEIEPPKFKPPSGGPLPSPPSPTPSGTRLVAGGSGPPAVAEATAALPASAKLSAIIFLCGVALIVLLGVFPWLRPLFADAKGKLTPLSMTITIECVMFTAATLIVLLGKVKPADITKQSLLPAGITALVALFGLAWLADTFISANNGPIVSVLETAVDKAPFAFALALFAVAALTTSQSGATRAIMPIGLALAIPAQFLVGMWSSVIGIYFFPANGSQIAAVGIDQTGTTRIGRYVLNHSFMLPTLICWAVSVAVGAAIAILLHGA